MKSKILYLFLSVLILGISSCEYSYIEPEISDLPPIKTVSFANDIQPVFDDKCIGCHFTGGDSPDLSEGNSYFEIINNGLVDTINPTNSILYNYPDSTAHSGTGYSGSEKELVLNWIKEGAIDDTQIEPISFSDDIQPVFNNYCISCHNTGGDFPNLTPAKAYNQIINNGLVNLTNPEESTIYYYPGSENHDWAGYSTADGKLVLRWINEGALNNK